MKYSSQAGSALTLILVGIALLAAVTYVISQSFRVGEGQTSSKEQLALHTTDMLQFFEAVRGRYVDMSLSQSVLPENVSFKTDVYTRVNGTVNCANDNANCTTAECKIFSPGSPVGVTPIIFNATRASTEQATLTAGKNGTLEVGQIAVDGVGTSAPELIVRVNGVSPAFCNHYNAQQGLTTNFTDTSTLSDIGETESSSLGAAFGGCGAGGAFNTTDIFGDEATMFKGKKTFCSPTRGMAANARLGVTFVLQSR